MEERAAVATATPKSGATPSGAPSPVPTPSEEHAALEERAADRLQHAVLESLEDELLAVEAQQVEIDARKVEVDARRSVLEARRIRLKMKRVQSPRNVAAEGGGIPQPPPPVAPRHVATNDDLMRAVRDAQGVEGELAAGGGISDADHLIHVGAVASGRFAAWDTTRGASTSFETRCREEDDSHEELADLRGGPRAPDRWGGHPGHWSDHDRRGEARYGGPLREEDDGHEEPADHLGGPRAPDRWGGHPGHWSDHDR